MPEIAFVKIYLDDNIPEYMQGIVRCSEVVSEDEDGNVLSNNEELVDNAEYHSVDDLLLSVASRLGISVKLIEVQY